MAKVTDNTNSIFNNIQQKASVFLRFMSEEIVKDAEVNTPKKSGRMRMDIVKQVLGLSAKIKWGKDYAVFQETKQFKNYSTPGTGPHFAQNAAEGSISKTSSVAKKAGLL